MPRWSSSTCASAHRACAAPTRSSGPSPSRELEPGEQREVSFRLEPRDFASYDTRVAAWRTDSGEFDILVGASSRDIRLQETVTLEFPDAVRIPFDRLTPLRDWLADPAARERIEPAMASGAPARRRRPTRR